MEAKKIYIDMDGVLADFDRGVHDLCGLEISPKEQRTQEMDQVMWEKIREVSHFYDRLKLMPGAKEMFSSVYGKYGDRCEILTGIPKPKRGIVTAEEDKKNWVRRFLSKEIVVNIVYKEQKPEYCSGRECILIDDMEQNIAGWVALGGTGILHKSAEETLRKLQELGVL